MNNYEAFGRKQTKLKLDLDNSVRRGFKELIYMDVEEPEIKSIFKTIEKNFEISNRPTLMALSCEAVGGEYKNTIPANLMITLAGIGVGIHDDILDRSVKKKFTDTIPGRYNDEKALLVGDLLIVKGLTSIQEMIKRGCDPQKLVDIVHAIQQHFIRICEGVFMEKSCVRSVKTDLEYCDEIIKKYASDGEACAKIGALLGNGSKEEVEALACFGRKYCYVYRLGEEVVDLFNIDNNLRRRIKYENIPLPLLFAAKTSKENEKKIESIISGPLTDSDLDTLQNLCLASGGFKYVQKKAEDNIREGIKVLNSIRPSTAKANLKRLINSVYPI